MQTKRHRAAERCPKAAGEKIYCLKCRSAACEIRKIESFIKKAGKENDLSDAVMYRLLVASTEAANNAILHGNKLNRNKSIGIKCSVRKTKIVVQVRDEGAGFDPKKIPNPTEEKNLLKESGRGVYLMRSLMDSVKVKTTKTGSLVEMELKREKKDSSEPFEKK
jgi:serine/threonine-protein kinase RsbW